MILRFPCFGPGIISKFGWITCCDVRVVCFPSEVLTLRCCGPRIEREWPRPACSRCPAGIEGLSSEILFGCFSPWVEGEWPWVTRSPGLARIECFPGFKSHVLSCLPCSRFRCCHPWVIGELHRTACSWLSLAGIECFACT